MRAPAPPGGVGAGRAPAGPPGEPRGGPRSRLWPDQGQELLLRAALAPAPACVEAWARAEARLASGPLDRGSERLLPLVWSNLRRHGVDAPRLERAYRTTRAANEARLAQLGELVRALEGAGVPTVVLKGAALVEAYGDPGLRPMSDVDLLVPLDRVAQAGAALRERGWAPQAPVTPVTVRRIHSVQFTHPERAAVDLHWHVFEECCRADDDADLWAAAVPTTVAGAPSRALAAADQLLHVCTHAEKWVSVPGVRWVADAVVLVRGGRVRWERLVAQAVKRRFVLRMRAQLAYLRAAFEAPIPGRAVSMLGAAPVSALERLEQRWSVRDRRRPWALVYWCNHVRSASGGVVGAALTFPRYLQATWHLASLAEVPHAAVARVLRQALARPRPA